MPKPIFVLAAIVIGGLVALQPGINSDLARRLTSPFGASFVSVTVSFGLALGFLLSTRQTIAWSGVTEMPWHLWFGGFIGFIFVIGSLALAPILGASLLFAAVVAGQMIVATIVDMTGFGGYQSQTFDPWRLVAITLVIAGVWLFERSG